MYNVELSFVSATTNHIVRYTPVDFLKSFPLLNHSSSLIGKNVLAFIAVVIFSTELMI